MEIDNLFNDDDKRKKKLNSGDKGKNGERELCKIFTERFKQPFSRSVGSGNRGGQVANLPAHAIKTFSGDLCPPEFFSWVCEIKRGYEDIDLNFALLNGNSQLDAFLKQADEENDKSDRKPMLLWRKNRKPWTVFVHTADLPHLEWQYRVTYREWSAIALENFLKLPDSFFFTLL